MKIVAICGQGLGSSQIIEMNLREVLTKLNKPIEVSHTNLNSFDPKENAIIAVVCGQDLSDSINFKNKIILKNLFDKDELQKN